MNTRLILVDDHRMLRAGLRALLNAEAGMEVVAEAENGREAVQLVRDVKPDIVIMDINMPDLNGIEATRQAIAAIPGLKVVALSAYADRRLMAEALKAGASGYVLKESAFEELAAAIRAILANKVYLSPRVAGAVVEDFIRADPRHPQSAFRELTPREREVLQLTAEGKATKEVAQSLKVSVKTVETHRRNIMEKLNVDSIAALTKYAIREGVTSVDT